MHALRTKNRQQSHGDDTRLVSLPESSSELLQNRFGSSTDDTVHRPAQEYRRPSVWWRTPDSEVRQAATAQQAASAALRLCELQPWTKAPRPEPSNRPGP
ncbi:hypothetical protein ACKKBG_A09250 [Auxenochlorella protothecoides x Auxenochlorella symbiontica]